MCPGVTHVENQNALYMVPGLLWDEGHILLRAQGVFLKLDKGKLLLLKLTLPYRAQHSKPRRLDPDKVSLPRHSLYKPSTLAQRMKS